jgi:hypothetical protein
MDRLQCNRWNVDKFDVPVEAAVEREVAEVRRHGVHAARVVAEHGQRRAAFGGRGLGEGVGDVDHPLVVASLVLGDLRLAEVDGGDLAGAPEVQQRAALGIRIPGLNPGAIPALAAVVGGLGVAGIVGVETVRHGDGVEDRELLAVPDLPRAAERSTEELPSGAQALGLERLIGSGALADGARERGREYRGSGGRGGASRAAGEELPAI